MADSGTLTEQCKCGGAIIIDCRRHRRTWADLYLGWVSRHAECIGVPEPEEPPRGDVFAHIETSPDFHAPELQLGFQRHDW